MTRTSPVRAAEGTPGPAAAKSCPISVPLAPVAAGQGDPAAASEHLEALAAAGLDVSAAAEASSAPAAPEASRRLAAPREEGQRAAGTNPVAEAMSENELERAVRRILRDLPQILAYHTRDSRRSPEGFPDWCLVGRGVMFRELKTARGKLTAAQQTWLMQLKAAHADMAVWRPQHLLDGTIARELAALAGFRDVA
jgi:hypothetical protein